MPLTQSEIVQKLGPLAPLAGLWEGSKGDDIAPSDDRKIENNKFRELIKLEPFGPVNNHEQELFGLRYHTTAWRIGEADAFHEETGYWLWDPKNRQVMKCFLVPRGISVIAGATVEPQAKEFKLVATLGSPTYGICSNPFLDEEFKTVKFELDIKVHGSHSFSYSEDTQIIMKGRSDIFHHKDSNTLTRAPSN